MDDRPTLSEPETPLPNDPTLFATIADALLEQGYALLPAALPAAVAEELTTVLAAAAATDFETAGVGRGERHVQDRLIRRDKTCWLTPGGVYSPLWFDWCDRLRLELNRRLFLGLFDFESHFAIYQPGDFYQKHVDAFNDKSHRILSLVAYLNLAWQPGQGGELVLYDPATGDALLKVLPEFATVVVFLSELFPHEVLPAKRTRYSVAGWYRVNGSIGGRIDPPA